MRGPARLPATVGYEVMSEEELVETPPEKLPLDGWHRAHGARMVPFAGYEMPIQFEGIVVEHDWTRAHAGLFDVSHMGQLSLSGEGAAQALEALVPGLVHVHVDHLRAVLDLVARDLDGSLVILVHDQLLEARRSGDVRALADIDEC